MRAYHIVENEKAEERISTADGKHMAFVRLRVPEGVNGKILLGIISNEIANTPGFEDFHTMLSRKEDKVIISKKESRYSPLNTLGKVLRLRAMTENATNRAREIDVHSPFDDR
jgi:hypothetical protein